MREAEDPSGGEGDVVLTIRAEDRDNVPPRPILYELLRNPHCYFRLHPSSGELSLTRQADREDLAGAKPSNLLQLEVLATELSDGERDGNRSSSALVTIIVRPQAANTPEESACLCGQKKNMIQVMIFVELKVKYKPQYLQATIVGGEFAEVNEFPWAAYLSLRHGSPLGAEDCSEELLGPEMLCHALMSLLWFFMA